MTRRAQCEVLLVVTAIEAIAHIDLRQIYLRRGHERVRRVTEDALGNALRIILVMRHVPMGVGRLAAFGLEDRVRSD